MNEIVSVIEKLPLSQLQCMICIEFTDDKPSIYIDGVAGRVSESSLDSVDATVRLSSSDLEAVISGQQSSVSLFTTGKVEVDGDISVAFKLKEIIG